MAFGLALLLNAASQALDQLWLQRASHDVGLLLADYPDPGLPSPLEGSLEAETQELRLHLLRMGAQMRMVGLPAVSQAILAAPFSDARKLVLLALAGSTPWQAMPGRAGQSWRPAGQHAFYRLECRVGADAAHAPHAIRERSQTLWVLSSPDAEALPAPLCRLEGGTACLSLDVALWEVLAALEAAGETTLVAAIDALQPCGTLAASTSRTARVLRKHASAA